MLLKVINAIADRLLNLPHNIRYKYYINYVSQYSFASNSTFFRGEWSKVYGLGRLIVGRNSYCGARCGFQISKGHKIEIGKDTAISHNVRIYTSNRDPLDIINAYEIVKSIEGDVVIGENCWIGANVMILQGVTIGDNVVIGANSVVSKSIQSNVIAAGAPIKIIKKT